MNPNMADYRASYSQTCLALSQNFLNKKEISDTDKENGSTLIQQSVREAKAAISLDQSNSIYWSNLAGIYKSLIGLVDGAADWSVQAYQQAAILNPNDPMLKLNLGGLYFGLNDYESADRVFEEVVVSKNDYANGWYNWAYSGKQLGKLELAVNRMKKALELVPADSTDYETANKVLNEWQKELDELNKKKTEEAKKTSTEGEKTLTTPEALPSKTDEKKEIKSNEDMAPPVEVTPTIEISPTP
jgi:Flp pilus assembly protein TadD